MMFDRPKACFYVWYHIQLLCRHILVAKESQDWQATPLTKAHVIE